MAKKFSKSSTSGGNLFDIREIKNSSNRPSYDKNGNSNNSITNLDNKRRISRRINNDNDNTFTFSQIYRLVVGIILIMVLCLGFGNGTLEFMNDYKTTYAVENYVQPNISSFADVDGNTFKFNDDVYLYDFGVTNPNSNNFGLDINIDNLSLITENTLLFTLYNSSQSYDFYVKPSWTHVTYRVFLNGYNNGFSFRNLGLTLQYYGYYNSNNILEWSTDYFNNIRDDFYISFSDDFSTFIIPGTNNSYFNNRCFINFINGQTTLKNDLYSDDFYYYDWRIKLNQLSNFRPLFEAHDLLEQYEGGTYARDEYMEQLQEYYNLGYVTYIGHNVNIPRPNDILWIKTDEGKNSEFSKQIDDFILVIALWLNPLTPLRASACFDLVNDVVTPNSWYNEWIETEDGESVKSSFLDFANGVFGFLYSPINFTYNIYVFFDFVMRW